MSQYVPNMFLRSSFEIPVLIQKILGKYIYITQ